MITVKIEDRIYNIDKEFHFHFLYRNYRGEHSFRTVAPDSIFYGSANYHPEAQWLMRAYDIDKNAERIFALKDITAFESLTYIGEILTKKERGEL